jgi:hypothetical protein
MWDSSENSATVRMKKQGDYDWPRHYAALLQYCKEYGHCNVNKRFKTEDYKCVLPGLGDDGGDYHYSGRLAGWLSNQRAHRKGKRGNNRKLPDDRLALLQSLVDEGISTFYSFCLFYMNYLCTLGKLLWDASDISGTRLLGSITWPINYAALLEYRRVHGHCNVPQASTFECDLPNMAEDGGPLRYAGSLGRWLMTQRQSKRGQRNSLSPEREALLQKLVDEGYLVLFRYNFCFHFYNN